MAAGPVDARTARDAMIVSAEVHGPLTTVAKVRSFFEDDHKHCAVIADGCSLLAVVVRKDLLGAYDDDLARDHGTVAGCVTSPDTPLEPVRLHMVDHAMRRLAVVDVEGRLLGILCLKRTGLGFCSETDVQARVDERLRRRTGGL